LSDIIALNADTQTEDNREELEHGFSRLPNHLIKMLGYFRSKVDRKDIYGPTVRSWSLNLYLLAPFTP
jgi:hypothetical protein